MADAYLAASEGHTSLELVKLNRILRFGLEAVTRRRYFLHAEYRRMMCAESIATAYQQREQATNWAAWAKEHPADAKLLSEAEKLCR